MQYITNPKNMTEAAHKSLALCAALSLFILNSAYTQENSQIKIINNNGESFSLLERSDWLRYDNEKYIGHTYREVRSSIINEGQILNGDTLFKGVFFVLEETLRDSRESARAVNDIVSASFSRNSEGEISIIEDNGFPSLRGFPVYSTKKVERGSKWTSQGKRAVDPLNNGKIVIVPIVAEYEYSGIEDYKGEKVYRINARYASRYGAWREIKTGGLQKKQLSPEAANSAFSGVSGTHSVDILIRVKDGSLLFSRDNLDETYLWSDGSTVRFHGFTLTFGEGIVPMDRLLIEEEIKRTEGIEFESVAEGLRLTINNLQFKADSDELLNSEKQRLDNIAASLLSAKNKTFLVEGHTAHIGITEGEMELSQMRAKRIVDEMILRGLASNRFIYKGWGGTRPIGDNSTDEGRLKNRRVEITILE